MQQQSDQHPLSLDLDARPRIPRTPAAHLANMRTTLRAATAGALVLLLAACGPGGPPVNDVTADGGTDVLDVAEAAANPNAPGVASRTPRPISST